MPGFDAPLTIETSVDLAWLGLAWLGLRGQVPEQGQLFVNVENDGAFNKGATSHNDIFDVFRLTLTFSYFLFSKISAVEIIDLERG